jgi:predicted AAA+ superfamily ATPase
MVLDEVQNAPELFSYIQVLVDESSQKGQFILTGSQQFQVIEKITQSLAGRTALCTLLPLSLQELSARIPKSLDELLIRGLYPRLYAEEASPQEVYRFYYQTYLERDLPQLIHLKDLQLFQRFMKLLAGRAGQILNKSNLSNDLGVSVSTVEHWLSLLETEGAGIFSTACQRSGAYKLPYLAEVQ